MKLLKQIAAAFKREVRFYRLVAAHAGTPKLAKRLLTGALTYALSPVDLIPDWIPVLGHLDDVVIVPGLVWLAMRSVPNEVVRDCRQRMDADEKAPDLEVVPEKQ